MDIAKTAYGLSYNLTSNPYKEGPFSKECCDYFNKRSIRHYSMSEEERKKDDYDRELSKFLNHKKELEQMKRCLYVKHYIWRTKMEVLQRGHRYELDHRDGKNKTVIQYVNKEPGQECEGVIQQEILRMMLDRNRYCTACQPNAISKRIEYHLQMALVLHEMRALERKVQKGELRPEYVKTGSDGHFDLVDYMSFGALETFNLEPYTDEWDRPCNHHSKK